MSKLLTHLARLALLATPQILTASFGLSCGASQQEPASQTLFEDSAWQSKHLTSEPDAQPPATALESCGNSSEGFDGWLESFRQHAVDQRISASTVATALQAVRYDEEVLALDRSQLAHKLSFEDFYKRHVTRERLSHGKALRRELADLLAKLETKFGVPPEVLLAIWGLETDYGQNTGSRSSLTALATLAYDCRRAERFREELLSALRILERGDLAVNQMVGAWAGELGQTQFLPSSYERFATDFDGDGRANLVGSAPDALASTANYLQQHGWREKEGYAPSSHNFEVLTEWNKSGVYCQTIAEFASKLGKNP